MLLLLLRRPPAAVQRDANERDKASACNYCKPQNRTRSSESKGSIYFGYTSGPEHPVLAFPKGHAMWGMRYKSS